MRFVPRKLIVWRGLLVGIHRDSLVVLELCRTSEILLTNEMNQNAISILF